MLELRIIGFMSRLKQLEYHRSLYKRGKIGDEIENNWYHSRSKAS